MNNLELLTSIVSTKQFNREELEFTFKLTQILEEKFKTKEGRLEMKQYLRYEKVLELFYAPSSRTFLSFGFAATHLGMHIHSISNAGEFSSSAKGETLADFMKVVCGYYPSAVVLRHTDKGAAEIAAKILGDAGIPLINGGDGPGEHPTQAILDLYTMYKKFGRIDGLTIVAGGDLRNSRVVRSLSYLLAKFNDVRIKFLSPEELMMEKDILSHLSEKNVEFQNYTDSTPLPEVIDDADVVYWTRIQGEYLTPEELQKAQGKLQLNKEVIQCMKKDAIIMHPLPRVGEGDVKGRVPELTIDVDDDPRAHYFQQSNNGMFVRMALFLILLNYKQAVSLTSEVRA